MYNVVKMIHSYWAYLVFIMLVIATINALIKFFGKKEFHAVDFRISLFTLIVTHIQLLIGIVLFFASNYLSTISDMGMGEVMKNKALRSNIIEHPIAMILAVVFFKMLAIFYTLALILVLAKIPWNVWF
jgi:hypothetical protein